MRFWVVLVLGLPACAESLHFNINWPSGLELGEATIASSQSQGIDKKPGDWKFSLDIDASVPGFTIREQDSSTAGPDLCAIQLDKSFTHGKKKNEEKITFDQQKNTFTRETVGGGKSDTSASACARDALTYLQFARRELSQGRIVPDQKVVFGAQYQVHMDFKGAQTIKVGAKMVEADRTLVTIKGPSTDLAVEIFFAHDPSRTPLLARLPLALGTFTVELQP